MTVRNISGAVHELSPTQIASDPTSGLRSPLGMRYEIGAPSADYALFYVSAGAADATDGDVVRGGDTDRAAAATDELVSAPADQGDQIWVYVTATEAIRRGEQVMHGTVDSKLTLFQVVPAGANLNAQVVVAVAQHNFAAGDSGWMLKFGVGVVQSNAVTANIGLKPAGTAGRAAAAAATDPTFGKAITANSAAASGFADVDGTALALAQLDCRG